LHSIPLSNERKKTAGWRLLETAALSLRQPGYSLTDTSWARHVQTTGQEEVRIISRRTLARAFKPVNAPRCTPQTSNNPLLPTIASREAHLVTRA
jgi:hypothetical protein